MSEEVLVHCHSCGQQYRVAADALGRAARCEKCDSTFVVTSSATADEQAILEWLSEEEDSGTPSAGGAPESAAPDSPPPSSRPSPPEVPRDDAPRAASPRRAARPAVKLPSMRDSVPEPWQCLDADVRLRLGFWYSPRPGEKFLRFFRDSEFEGEYAGAAGIILTDQRIICRVETDYDDYPLSRDGRIEILRMETLVIAHIYQEGRRPTVVKLDHPSADELMERLDRMRCRWVILT